MTMKELGKLVGVSEAAIGYYETEKRKINYEMLLKLAEALECNVEDIFKGEELQNSAANYVSSSLSDAVSLSANGQKNKPVITKDNGLKDQYEEIKQIFAELTDENVDSLKDYALYLLQRQKSQGGQ